MLNFLFSRKPVSDFKSKLIFLIKSVIPYSYPEKKTDIFGIPNFEQPVSVTKNPITNFLNFLYAKRKLKKLDLSSLEWTYNNFNDEFSKETMLQIIVYKLFKNVKLRFPLYYSACYDKLADYEKLVIDDEQISLWNDIIKLKKYDLRSLGYDVKLWFNAGGIMIDYMLEQYRYKNLVTVEENDNVIDGGACYGDTAMYFANKSKGKVFSFEFMKENLDVFKMNLTLNPQYKDRISLIECPLGLNTGEKLYAAFNGPGTCVTTHKFPDATEFETISIDDFVKQNNIEKIDFIKLDVEGSEENILKGASETIRKFKPKLAVCAYHKQDDLIVLPKLIKEILPEYKLYLNHNTITPNETVIYAKA